ncbi:P-selectin glycoprotein ligand 1 [Bubalus bubalis]|uniref:P-selectin glycoprotein ligand 1 n=1 Tax=Bubalus bubalis TaxID=89462 RepID=UPI001D11FC69|nr:P-selectin glycoprotein ligand 1 [Bubalus bubalis]XP_006045092.2 P-selectin glycoprotein ligand 1 [Bubalus bubalis]XP_006045093.2 P-selectin glycoprotein ligand 1 [Bubalus bubalis]XP_006045094.2 P-selectin glycoprotein ligand 1 [Bubalus bubalis]XP_025123236.2 P-selectin glycoprotein ligand 1 [Bubalus bubalis]
MFLQLLLLLALLGPGSSHQLGNTSKYEPVKVPGEERVPEDDEDYDYIGQTDPPEMLDNITEVPKFLLMVATLGQRESAGPVTPESFILEVSTRDSAVLSATGATTEKLSPKLVTLVPLTRELVTEIPPKVTDPSTELAAATEALSTDPVTTEALSTEPRLTEALSTEPMATEALSTEPRLTEALSTEPAATEALSTEPRLTEALSTEPRLTEALSTEPAATEALSTEPRLTEALSTEPAATESLSTEPKIRETLPTEPATTEAPFREPTTIPALPTDPTTVEALPTRHATTRGLTTALPVASDTPKGTTVAAGDLSDDFTGNKDQSLFPWSSVAPIPAEGVSDPGPVKQCLLAILILALLATIFLVCTVVLAIRLSRKNHLYPVRDYSPSEMVCISSLLPERGEGPAPMPNGDLPKAKDQGRKTGPGEDREGDDLTLRSFLP